jgi:MFS superfamily sulfate permease-like transporter
MKLFEHVRQDLSASIVVFFVAVPLCLGIALASGAPLIAGLIAGVIGGVLVGALSASPLGVSGPAAGLVAIVLTAIDQLGAFDAFLVAVVISGFMQVALGVLRAGVLAYFFPSAVIKGMLTGIGIIIILKQLPHAVGYDVDPEGSLSFIQRDGGTTFRALGRMLDFVDLGAVLVASISLAILLLWERVLAHRGRLFEVIQGPLVAVTFGILFQLACTRWWPALALAPDHLVNVPVIDGFASFKALFTFPDWSQLANPAVYLTAATLAIVASIETLLCVEATDRLDPLKRNTPTNRELCAQGAGNIASGLIGGLPITQVIVRSSANIQSGARSKLSTMLHGLHLAVFVLALPTVLNLVPLAALASILLLVGYKLAKPVMFATIYRQGPAQFIPFVVTVVAVVLTDLLTGISIGMVVALVFVLHRNYLNSHFMHIERGTSATHGQVMTLHLAEEVTFLNKGAIRKELSRIPDQTHVVIDASDCFDIDLDVLEIIEDFRNTCSARRITAEFIAPRLSADEHRTERAG